VDLRAEISSLALTAGFDDVGFCAARTCPEMQHLREWLARGFHRDMEFMARHAKLRLDPVRLFPGARTAVMVVKSYWRPEPDAGPESDDSACAPGHGIVSAHARGRDYHVVMKKRLKRIAAFLKERGHTARSFTDSAPVMEKVLAVRAGLGFAGKNSLLCHPRFGSWVFIGGLLTDADIEPSIPYPPARSPCNSCRLCVDACPTRALDTPGVLRADRCLAYWTIESRCEFPSEIRANLSSRLFGCDLCQQVCPMNRDAAEGGGGGGDFGPVWCDKSYSLERVLQLTESGFQSLFGHTTMKRAGLEQLRRNASALM